MAKIKLKKPQRKDRDLFIDLGAGLINVTDEILDEVGEIAGDGGELIIDVAAGAVKLFDKTADIIGSGGGEGLFNISMGANASFASMAVDLLHQCGFKESN